MDKHTFISEISKPLKELGYRKRTNYWYKTANELIFCINVQGSQWDKDNYYVEIGVAKYEEEKKCPTILYWFCRHRCIGKNRDVNIEPEDLMRDLIILHNSISIWDDLLLFLDRCDAKKVVNQYWF